MPISSAALNAAIVDIEDTLDVPLIEVVGLETTGKCIPYIGWYWRTVDFDADTFIFGIVPRIYSEWEKSDGFIGFMENNKWDYAYTRETTEDEWANIKQLLIRAVAEPLNTIDFQAVFDAIQVIGHDLDKSQP